MMCARETRISLFDQRPLERRRRPFHQFGAVIKGNDPDALRQSDLDLR